MTEDQFLEARSKAVRERLRLSSDSLGRDLERAVGPWVREHPKSGLAAGAATGFLLGAVLGALRPGRGRATNAGALAGGWSFIRRTAGVTLRSAIARQILGTRTDATPSPESPDS